LAVGPSPSAWKMFLLENPLFGRCAQLRQFRFASSLGIKPHHRFGSRKPVAHPRTVLQNQLEPVGANHFGDLAAEELARIGLQLPSELLFHFRRQAEVLSFRIEGTNFSK